MDVCVVITFPERENADAARAALRDGDRMIVHDNTTERQGFAAASNAAARKGSGELVLFLNPDGIPAPNCFERLEAALDDPEIVAAEGSLGPRWDRPPDADGYMDWLSGGCLCVRRSAFEEVGGFDERLFMYCEDVDLSYKLKRLGKLHHCADALFEHDSGERPFKAKRRNFRNWLVIERRYGRARIGRMLRDALFALRRRRWTDAAARLTGIADYLIRARRWA